MRILVCGGRKYGDYAKVSAVLDDVSREHSKYYTEHDNWLPFDIAIIHGGARGADLLADQWAVTRYAKIQEFKADWDKHGKAAGPIRNQQMLDEGKPDLVVAFPGGRGTADMVRRAKKAGIKVMEIDSERRQLVGS